MRLTTKMRYGTRAMLDLALHEGDEPTSLRDVATRQELSPKYLEQLLVTLQAAGLVKAVRGAKGGYRLTQPPREVTLRQVYEVLESSEGLVDCITDPQSCTRCETCVTHDVWAEMQNACMAFLHSITLEDLVHRARQKQLKSGMYYI